MSEEWRTIEFGYLVSSLGRVRNGRTDKILKPQVHYGRSATIPYHRVRIGGKNKRVHRLVAQAFHDNPHGLPEVDHINGDSIDNRASNLEWVSAKENAERRAAQSP